jgi:hypothetical protein
MSLPQKYSFYHFRRQKATLQGYVRLAYTSPTFHHVDHIHNPLSRFSSFTSVQRVYKDPGYWSSQTHWDGRVLVSYIEGCQHLVERCIENPRINLPPADPLRQAEPPPTPRPLGPAAAWSPARDCPHRAPARRARHPTRAQISAPTRRHRPPRTATRATRTPRGSASDDPPATRRPEAGPSVYRPLRSRRRPPARARTRARPQRRRP